MLEATKSTLTGVRNIKVYIVYVVHCQDVLEAIQLFLPICSTLSQKEAFTQIQKCIHQIQASFSHSLFAMTLNRAMMDSYKSDAKNLKGFTKLDSLTTSLDEKSCLS